MTTRNTGITPPPPRYHEGDEIRQNGYIYRRINGNWVNVGRDPDVEPDETAS